MTTCFQALSLNAPIACATSRPRSGWAGLGVEAGAVVSPVMARAPLSSRAGAGPQSAGRPILAQPPRRRHVYARTAAGRASGPDRTGPGRAGGGRARVEPAGLSIDNIGPRA